MDLYCEERNKVAGACVQMVGAVGFVILVLAICELPFFRGLSWMGWVPMMVCAASIQWVIPYVWNCFNKTDRVTLQEVISAAKHGGWLRNNSLHIPIESIVEASMVECGIDMVRGDKGESGVSQKPGHAGGVRLLLDDGSSRFIAFEYPAKALAAIQEAIKSND